MAEKAYERLSAADKVKFHERLKRADDAGSFDDVNQASLRLMEAAEFLDLLRDDMSVKEVDDTIADVAALGPPGLRAMFKDGKKADSVEWLLDKADTLLVQEKWGEMRKTVDKAREMEKKLGSEHGRSTWLLAEALSGLGKYEEALPELFAGMRWAILTENPRHHKRVLLSFAQGYQHRGHIARLLMEADEEVARQRLRASGKDSSFEDASKKRIVASETSGDELAVSLLIAGTIYESLRWWDKAVACYEEAVRETGEQRWALCVAMLRHAKESRARGEDAVTAKKSTLRMCRVCRKVGTTAASGAAKILQCSRCTYVYYCSAHCQSADWKDHKQYCRKLDAAKCCDLCWEEAASVSKCGRCNKTKYCGASCQKEDWQLKHRHLCLPQ